MNGQGLTPSDGDVVLVVDDNDQVRENVIRMLRSAGIRSVGAGSYAKAVDLQAVHLPAVAVIDVRLPDGSGIDLADAIQGRNPETRVIMLTRFAALDRPVDGVDRFYAYLIMPVRSVEFLQVVRDALEERQRDREAGPG